MRHLYLGLLLATCLAACGPVPSTKQPFEPYAAILDTYPSLGAITEDIGSFSGRTTDGTTLSGRQIIEEFLSFYDPEGGENGRQAMMAYWQRFTEFRRYDAAIYYRMPVSPTVLYLYKIAHALWIERNGGLNWSLRDSDSTTLGMFFWEKDLTMGFPDTPRQPEIPEIRFDYFVRGLNQFTYSHPQRELSSLYYSWNFAKKLRQDTPGASIEQVIRWTKNSMAHEGYGVSIISNDTETSGLEIALQERSDIKTGETTARVLQLALTSLNIPHVTFSKSAIEVGETTKFYHTYLYLPKKGFIDTLYLTMFPAVPSHYCVMPGTSIADGQPPLPYLLRFLGGSLAAPLSNTVVVRYVSKEEKYVMYVSTPYSLLSATEIATLKNEFPSYPPLTLSDGTFGGFGEISQRPFIEMIDPSVDIWR